MQITNTEIPRHEVCSNLFDRRRTPEKRNKRFS